MATQPTLLDQLTNGMAGNTAPGAAAATAGKPEPKGFWIVQNGNTVAATPAQLADLVQKGYDEPVMDQAGGDWKKPADFGFVRSAPTPPPAPAANVPPVPPTPPTAPVAPAAPSLATAAVASTTAVTTGSNSQVAAIADRELSHMVRDEAGAAEVMALLATPDMSVHDVIDASEGGSGMSYLLPFVNADEKGWQTPKTVAELKGEILENLPSGDRPWTGIYIATRMGAIGWDGAGTAGQKGKAPHWRFILPSPRVQPASLPLHTQMMKIGSKIQFTKSENREKFDKLGRLSPFLNVLVWRPGLGFGLLVANGFRTVQITNTDARKWDEKCVFKPVSFTIHVEETVNKKVLAQNPEAKNAKWTDYGVKGEIDAGARGVTILNEFNQQMQRDRIGMMNVVKNFLEGKDFEGLTLGEVTALLPKYDEFLVGDREAQAGA